MSHTWVGTRGPPVKNSFLCAGWAKKSSVGRSEFFFFPNSIFYKLECKGGKGKKNNFGKYEKSSSRPFLVQSGSGQETTF